MLSLTDFISAVDLFRLLMAKTSFKTEHDLGWFASTLLSRALLILWSGIGPLACG